MTGHGVALAVIGMDGAVMTSKILAQCECGWHESFGEVVTWDLVRSTIDAHHQDVRNGTIGEPEAGR